MHQKAANSNKSKICTCLRAGLLMTPPTEWIHFENTTIEVAQLTWVCVCVHTRLMNKLKLGDIRACLLAKQKKNSIRGDVWVRGWREMIESQGNTY